MKKYFVRLRNKQYGPATIEELKRMGIDRNTLVWYKGLAQWTPAQQIPEIRAALFDSVGTSSTPRPAGRPEMQRRRQTSIDDLVNSYAEKERGTGKIKLMLVIMVIAIALGIIAYNESERKNLNNNTVSLPITNDSAGKETNRDDVMRTPKEIEESHPGNFLTIQASLDYKKRISGTIINTATVTTYKNIVFTVYYLDASGTNLDYEEFTVPDKVQARRAVDFSFKPKLPKGTAAIESSFSTAEIDK